MYIVYIIQSTNDSSYYTGLTINLNKRLREHNLGLPKHTSKKRPLKLVWHCIFNDKKKAIHFEKYLKSGLGIAFRNKRFI